jgi:hypothetical protein
MTKIYARFQLKVIEADQIRAVTRITSEGSRETEGYTPSGGGGGFFFVFFLKKKKKKTRTSR